MTEEIRKVIERHLGRSTEITIGKDKFKMSPLPVSKLPELYETTKILEGVTPDNPAAVMKNLNAELIEKVADLALVCLKPNYPDIEDEKLKEFAMRNVLLFANEMWAANMSLGEETREIGEIKRRQAVERIKEKVNA